MRSRLAEIPGWPTEFAERYRERGYWTDETFSEFVADRCERFSDNLAVVASDVRGEPVRWSYRELADTSARAAAMIAQAGVAPGDRVLLALPNIAEYVAVVCGCFRLGVIPIFGLPTHRELELSEFCALADAAGMVFASAIDAVDRAALYRAVSDRICERGQQPPVAIDVADWMRTTEPDDEPSPALIGAEEVAFLQLSGGTSGISKLIPRRAVDYLYSVRESARICRLDERTVMLVALPAAHNFPMSSPGILGVLHTGGTVVLARDPSPRTVFSLIEAERATIVAAVPPLAQAWLEAARRRGPDLSSLELVQVGGAKLSDALAPAIEQRLGSLQQVFGMAEGLVNYTRLDDPPALVRTTQGRPISPDDEVKIVDADDREVPEGEIGSLLTRGPYTIRGYYRADEHNRRSFTADGFYRTGDLVRRLPSGHLIVTGRDSDQINRGGEKVSAEELEGLVLAHPDVLDAAAVGLPDEYLGERVCLVVLTLPDRLRPDLIAYLKDAGLAEFKLPDSIEFLDEFPLTHIGKQSRRELRRMLTELLTAPS